MSLCIVEENATIRQLTDQATEVHHKKPVRNSFFVNSEFNNTLISFYSFASFKDSFAVGVLVFWWQKFNFKKELMNRSALILLLLLLTILNANAQTRDTLSSKKIYKKAILPAAFIGVGVLINGSRFEQNLQSDIRTKVGNDFEFKIDNYTQYAPVAELVLAHIMGVKAKNHWFDQTKYLLISNIITAGITHGLKNSINKTRPNGSDYSFPSGHTSFAFTNASVLYNEFHQTAPVLAYSGYAFAVTTGTFRMLNNKHWLSDVLVGAGIGIAVTELVYYFEPFKNFNPFKKSENITFVPTFDEDNVGFYFSYQF